MRGMMKVLFINPLLDGHRQRILRGEQDGGKNPFFRIDTGGKGTMCLGETLTL
jgi:hypothetical protein